MRVDVVDGMITVDVAVQVVVSVVVAAVCESGSFLLMVNVMDVVM